MPDPDKREQERRDRDRREHERRNRQGSETRTTPATEAPEAHAPKTEPGQPAAPRRDVPAHTTPAPDAPELTIRVDTVAWIILKAREFDMKEPGDIHDTEEDGDNPLGVLEDREDDPTAAELRGWISDLNETEQAELVAIMWLGRGDDEADAFPDLVDQALGQQGPGTARYLLGTPQLGDYLEEGLEKLGVDTANLEGSLR